MSILKQVEIIITKGKKPKKEEEKKEEKKEDENPGNG